MERQAFGGSICIDRALVLVDVSIRLFLRSATITTFFKAATVSLGLRAYSKRLHPILVC